MKSLPTELIKKRTPGVLYRNGEPIQGKDSFEQNRLRTVQLSKNPNTENETGYPGYRAEGFSLIVRQSKCLKNGFR